MHAVVAAAATTAGMILPRQRPVALVGSDAAVAGFGGHDGGVLEVGGEVEVLELLWEAARRGDLGRFAFHEKSYSQNKLHAGEKTFCFYSLPRSFPRARRRQRAINSRRS